MTVNPAVRQAGELFARQTGTGTPEMIAAATAWAFHEGGNVVRFNNPWNLHGVRGNYGGLAIGDWYAGSGDVHVAKFATLEDGVKAAVMNLRAHGSDFAAYDHVLAAAKKGDGLAFLDALSRSAWSAGRYGGPEHNALVPLYRQILPTITATPSQPPATEEPPVKPSALQTQPLLALGGLGTVLSAIVVFAVDQKYVTTDAGNTLVQVAAVVLPLVLAAIGRQFVTPNVKVDAAVAKATTPSVPAVVSSREDDFEYPTTDPAVLHELDLIEQRGSADGTPPTRRNVWRTYQANLARRANDPKPVAPVPVTPTQVAAATPAPTPAPTPTPSTARTAFVRDFGAAPSAIWAATIAKIMAAGLYDGRTAKDKATWRALALQFGGNAALVAYDVMNGTPGNVAPDESADQTANLARYFTGVYGIDGSTYRAYRDGQLVGQVVAGPTFDTAAWGASLGLNPNGWYD